MNRLIVLAALVAGAGACAPDPDDYDYEVVDETDGKTDAQSGKYAGTSADYDPGPTESWANLFATVPNYRLVSRALGATWLTPGPDGKTKLQTVNEARAALVPPKDPIAQYTLDKDKFRFEMAPIFYRGRLDGSARVLVVGQDAATDEALVHRAFIGGTGQKVQNLLNSLGITKSYVATNTFLYSIFEQYDEFTDELAQNGPIKDFRNEVLAKILAENKIELIVSFGSAAHTSVHTFVNEKLGGKLPPGVDWVQFMHPGAAAVGQPKPGSLEPADPTMLKLVAASFARGYNKIWAHKEKDPTWLVADADGAAVKRVSKYAYKSSDIPFRDMPFAVSPEIGRGGTKSERGASGMQVQLRSALGARYMAPTVDYPATVAKKVSGLTIGATELSWEPPKEAPNRHDSGPGAVWAQRFQATPGEALVEKETGINAANDFEHPVWYRGRLSGAPSVLVLMQDLGTDRLVAARAGTGELGQKLTHLFKNSGVGLDYVVFDAYPYSVANVTQDQVQTLAMSPSMTTFRNGLLAQLFAEKTTITNVITMGPIAEAAFTAFQTSAGQKAFAGNWIHLALPSDPNAVTSWNAVLGSLKEKQYVGPGMPYQVAATRGKLAFSDIRTAIPREDLPWGVPLWFGSTGDLSQQPHEAWIFWNAPRWLNTASPSP